MQKLATYVFSTSYLKPVQVLSRLSMLARRKVLHRSRTYRLRYSRLTTSYEQTTPLTFPNGTHYPSSLDEIGDGTFTFLNRRVYLGQPVDWFPQQESQLWRYNLHYFDYAVALGQDYARSGDEERYGLFRRLVREWIRSCPVTTPVAWDPHPVSLRLSNWIKAYSLFEPAIGQDTAFAKELRRSLYVHASFLENNLEYHLLGNHLIENGRALLLAGLFFTDSHADRWQKKGESILWRDLREQFLDDGGHYERSPMYHQIMLNLYREVVSVLQKQGDVVPTEVIDRVRAMQSWLGSVLHPDGQIALLNDAALGIAGDAMCELISTEVASDGFRALSESGYFVFRDYAAKNFLIFDCGPLGPDYQPGHGHCDTLSYELSLAGQRFIVDSGVGNYYGDLDWRMYYRSTRAHNTVVIDGAEQSEIWDRFRVARRAHPVDVHWANNGSKLTYVIGSHTGYRRLSGNVTHRRWMCWIDRRFWLVCDHITGRGRHHVESFIHFDPSVEVVRMPPIWGEQGVFGEVKRGPTSLKIISWGMNKISTYRGESDPIQGWVAPEFGLQFENIVWSLCREDRLPIWLGYVLWPEATDVAVDTAIVDEHTYRINVHSAGVQYNIFCGFKDIKVEKKQ